MVISRDQTGLVINNAGTCAAFRQLHSIKNIAHIALLVMPTTAGPTFLAAATIGVLRAPERLASFCAAAAVSVPYCLSLIVITAAAYKYSSSQQSTEKDIHSFFHKASLHLNTPQS